MKTFVTLMMMGVGVVAFTRAVALPSGWIRSIMITTISDNDVDGEVVQLTVNEVVDNSAHCPDSTGYAIRDPNTLRSSLALLMSAFVTGKQVDLFLTGGCDKSGMPAVSGVTLRKMTRCCTLRCHLPTVRGYRYIPPK
jgi:ribosomal protein S6E (S10)